MKKYIYSIVAATALFASCSQDAELNEIGNTDSKVITTIGASTEISTRAVVSSSDNTKVLWQGGDQIGVLGANGSLEAKNLAYTLDGNAGSTTGTFKNESSDISAISAIMYPYQESATWADSKLTCEIPSVQTATKGSFDKAAAIMYSIGNTTNVALKYAVNFLKVTVSESETNVHAITISSTTTALSGKMEITSSEGVSAATSGSQRYVTLTAGKGNVLAAGDYYIAVKAGNIENPTISYVYFDLTNHTATEKSKAGSGTLSFEAGKNVKPIKVKDWTDAPERHAVQLWADGPYFAEHNVGATSATEIGTVMTLTEAVKIGADYIWGANWRTPSFDDLNEFFKTINYEPEKVTTDDYEGATSGYTFTGINDYEKNSVFFPFKWIDDHNTYEARYLSCTTDEGEDGLWVYSMFITYLYDGFASWEWISEEYLDDLCPYIVRPVLAE